VLAIGGYNSTTALGLFPAFLLDEGQRVIVDLGVGAGIRAWIARHWVRLAVEFVGPLCMDWLAQTIDTIYRALHVVAAGTGVGD
jgi:hypothetical protein